MKKTIFLFLSFLLMFLNSCNSEKTKIENVSVVATSYIVIEQSNNKILEGYNYYDQRSVASISKIMTAIVCIENSNVDDITIVPEEIKKVDGSSIYLKVGEKVKIIDLLYGLLLRSGNDAAVTLALSISPTMEDFVSLMNQKASELNMTRSLFCNPHGLDSDDSGNISCAYDMAILYSYCLENSLFTKIVSSKKYGTYTNKNKLLQNYEYCTGGKTGFTTKARRTLVTSASKEDINLIMVTLNCGNDFESHKNKYEYYFNNYQSIKVLNKNENSFDNHVFYCKKDYFFITNQTDLSLFYKLNMKLNEIEVTLLNSDRRVVDYMKVSIRI